MKNFWNKLDRPFFALAPLAGYTDQSMRLMCKDFGVDVLYSEMISSEALWHNASCRSEYDLESNRSRNKFMMTMNDKALLKTLNLIKFFQTERPFVVQIFGADPKHIAFAAKYIASGEWHKDLIQISNIKNQNGNEKIKDNNIANLIKFKNYDIENSLKISSIPDGIDINMGCPARDVIKVGAGAALIKNQHLACEIIKAVKKEVKNIPISVKTRLGWNNEEEILDFSKRIEESGADALAIHGRTYKNGFCGPVNWDMILKVKRQLKIPVIGNGGINIDFDCKTVADLDGLMIGTGALGKPWIFEKLKNQSQTINEANWEFIKKNILKHAFLVNKLKGKQGILEFRKHIVWYLKGIDGVKQLRGELVRVSSYEEIEEILQRFTY